MPTAEHRPQLFQSQLFVAAFRWIGSILLLIAHFTLFDRLIGDNQNYALRTQPAS